MQEDHLEVKEAGRKVQEGRPNRQDEHKKMRQEGFQGQTPHEGQTCGRRRRGRERKKDLTAKVRQQGVGERTRRRRWRATGNKCVQRKEAAERGVNAAGSKGQSGRGGIGVSHDMEKAWKS